VGEGQGGEDGGSGGGVRSACIFQYALYELLVQYGRKRQGVGGCGEDDGVGVREGAGEGLVS
jgi:hypothetical protein